MATASIMEIAEAETIDIHKEKICNNNDIRYGNKGQFCQRNMFGVTIPQHMRANTHTLLKHHNWQLNKASTITRTTTILKIAVS